MRCDNFSNMGDNEPSQDDDVSSDDVHLNSCVGTKNRVDEGNHTDNVAIDLGSTDARSDSASSYGSSGRRCDDDGKKSIVSPARELDGENSISTPTHDKKTTPQVHRFKLDLDAAISDIYSNSTTTTSTMPLGDVVAVAQRCILRASHEDGPSTTKFADVWENICDAADDRDTSVSEAAAFVGLLQLTETVNRSAKGCISIGNDPSDNKLVIQYG